MITNFILPPALILILAGLAVPLLSRIALRNVVVLLAPVITLICIWSIPDGAYLKNSFLGFDLVFVQSDKLTRVFATVFAIMSFSAGLFALNQKSTMELAASLVYAGSAIGVTFAGDLITLFIFWELMAIASTLIVFCGVAQTAADNRGNASWFEICDYSHAGWCVVNGRHRR